MSEFDPTELNESTGMSDSRTTNKAGGVGYEMESPGYRLYKLVINNYLEDAYYEEAGESFARIVDAVDAVATEDPEFICQLAQYARHEEGLRDVSQVLLVLAANWGKRELAVDVDASWSADVGDDDMASPTQEHARTYAPTIIDRMDEFNTVKSLQESLFDTIPPKTLKKGMEDALHRKYVIVEMQDPETGETTTERFTFTEETDDEDEDETFAFLMAMKEGPFAPDMDIEEIPQYLELHDTGYVFDEYTAAKYMEREKEESLHDVLNVVRPEPRSENRNELFRKIAYGELDETSSFERDGMERDLVYKDHWTTDIPVGVDDVDALRNDRTWEAERSSETTTVEFQIDDAESLPETKTEGVVSLTISPYDLEVEIDGTGEIVEKAKDTSDGTLTVEVDLDEATEWRHRLDDMGIFARLRNLRNMRQAGLAGDEIFGYDGGRFGAESERIVRESKLAPFRFYQAFRACKEEDSSMFADPDDYLTIGSTTGLLDEDSELWLERAIDVACNNLPDTLENTFVAIDLSGSMFHPLSAESSMELAEIGALFGAMMAKRGGDVGVFGEDFAPVTVAGDPSTLDLASQIVELDVGHSTNGWKALDWLTETQKLYDQVVVFTDEQIWDSRHSFGEGRALKDAWDNYRQFNSEATCYMVDLNSYGAPSFPENYSNVVHLSGWSDAVLDYIDAYENQATLVSEISERDQHSV